METRRGFGMTEWSNLSTDHLSIPRRGRERSQDSVRHINPTVQGTAQRVHQTLFGQAQGPARIHIQDWQGHRQGKRPRIQLTSGQRNEMVVNSFPIQNDAFRTSLLTTATCLRPTSWTRRRSRVCLTKSFTSICFDMDASMWPMSLSR